METPVAALALIDIAETELSGKLAAYNPAAVSALRSVIEQAANPHSMIEPPK